MCVVRVYHFPLEAAKQMRTSVVARFVAAIALGALLALAQSPVPSMKSVDPPTAKVGDVLTVTGENLDRANVAEV